MDEYEVQHFDPSIFSSFQIWPEVGQNMLSPNIFSYSSKSVYDLDSILIILIRKTLN